MATSSGYLLKLDRALVHLEAIHSAIQGWLESDGVRVVAEDDPNTGEYVLRAEVSVQPGKEIGVLIGDCAHNMRTALSHLAYELNSFTGPPSIDTAKRSEFPIMSDPMKYWAKDGKGRPTSDSGVWKLGGADPNAQQIIETMQPYHGGDWELLAFVHDLDRIDKHRELTVVAAVTEQIKLSISYAKPITDSGRLVFVPPGPIEDGQELLRCHAQPLRPNQKVKYDHTATIGVAVAEGAYERWWVVDRLRAAENLIREQVIPPLLPYL